MPQPLARLIPREENITSSVIDGEAVLVNLSTGAYYSLLGAACDAWVLFEQSAMLRDVSEALAARYGVPAAQAEEDLQRFADALIAEGIVTLSEEPTKAAGAVELPPVITAYKAPELEIYRDMQELLALDPPMPGLRDVPWTATDQKPSKA